VIELVDISKRFGEAVALSGVSLHIAPGERLALVGENGAGKSSLMNVLYGLYQPDSGAVRFDGQLARLRTPADALARGIGMVHQHFTLVPTLSVAENVVLGSEPRRGLFLDLARAQQEVAATCRRLGFELELGARVDSLSVGSQQKAEIVKALHRGATTLILDEPTAVLTPQESIELFAVTRALSARGITVVLISHKLKEVLAFATRLVVMRRGKKVAELEPEETTPAELAELMVGPVEARPATPDDGGARPLEPAAAAPRLALEHVHARGLHDVSLEVREGEVLGVAGVDGNGQRELAEVVTGLRPFTGGRLLLSGEALTSLSPGEARRRGVAHIPEDRLARALIGELTVEENVALGRQRSAPFATSGRIDFAGRRARTAALLEAHDVRPRDGRARAGALSGGNQQKLVVGRELDGAPRLLVVVQPTRGLDVRAVEAVRARLVAEKRRGCAVLLVSLDLDEVLALADRLVVLRGGRIEATLAREAFDEQAIGRHMLGVAHA
jgi:simple sugar transport system ATP-binding protein